MKLDVFLSVWPELTKQNLYFYRLGPGRRNEIYIFVGLAEADENTYNFIGSNLVDENSGALSSCLLTFCLSALSRLRRQRHHPKCRRPSAPPPPPFLSQHGYIDKSSSPFQHA
jgi:hypothetical protein